MEPQRTTAPGRGAPLQKVVAVLRGDGRNYTTIRPTWTSTCYRCGQHMRRVATCSTCRAWTKVWTAHASMAMALREVAR